MTRRPPWSARNARAISNGKRHLTDRRRARKGLLRFLTCGSLDDGKSALIRPAGPEASRPVTYAILNRVVDCPIAASTANLQRKTSGSCSILCRTWRIPKRKYITRGTPLCCPSLWRPSEHRIPECKPPIRQFCEADSRRKAAARAGADLGLVQLTPEWRGGRDFEGLSPAGEKLARKCRRLV